MKHIYMHIRLKNVLPGNLSAVTTFESRFFLPRNHILAYVMICAQGDTIIRPQLQKNHMWCKKYDYRIIKCILSLAMRNDGQLKKQKVATNFLRQSTASSQTWLVLVYANICAQYAGERQKISVESGFFFWLCRKIKLPFEHTHIFLGLGINFG